jgi:4-hydroxy-3-methylbut-2-enyl diphosphate reductase IspH
MNIWIRRACRPRFATCVTVSAVQGELPASEVRSDITLPNGKSQREEILKAEHQQNLKDAAELADLADQLKIDLEKNDRFVLSMSTLKKTDDIEKLAKRIRARLRHN